MTQNRFGAFGKLFESDSYLALLHLGTQDARDAVSSVVKCCQSGKNPHAELARMLDDANWRGHIVAAVAVSALRHDSTSLNALWSALDSGSWVSPQLAVAAYLRDPAFSELAKTRLSAGCPLSPSRMSSMTSVQRHVAAGPSGARLRSAKAAASLLHLAGLRRPLPDWLAPVSTSRELVELLAEDVDRAGQIAENWLGNLQSLFRVLHVEYV
jgi:hypothetical protein